MAMKPVIASSFGPSGQAASSTAWTTNQVATEAANAKPAPSAIGRRFEAWIPVRLAATAAKISTASRPSRKTIIPELKTTVRVAQRVARRRRDRPSRSRPSPSGIRVR